MYSSRNSMIPGLTFNFLIHFEFIFLWCDGGPVSFAYSCPVFPKACIEEAIFPTLCILDSHVIDSLTRQVWVHFWTLYSVQLIDMCFLPVLCCFDPYRFVVLFEIRSVISQDLFFFLRTVKAICFFCVSTHILELFA